MRPESPDTRSFITSRPTAAPSRQIKSSGVSVSMVGGVMSKSDPSKGKKPLEMTTKEAMRKLFPPPVVKEAKKTADAQRKYKRS